MSTMNFLTAQQEITSRLRLDPNNSDQLTLAKRWLNQSQQEIWSRYDWPWALEREIVQTVIDKTAGTVSISAGDTAVAGSSTAFAAADVGKFIQFSSSNDWYKITAVASSIALTIETAYAGTSALSAGTYTIRKFFYSVSSSVEKVMDIRQAISPAKLTMVPFRQFDMFKPSVTGTGNPLAYAVWGYDGSNNWTFSPYPTPATAINLEVRFKKKATDMSADTDVSIIPEKWHSTVLLDGALYRGLEYVRTSDDDKRAEMKQRSFETGLAGMIADGEPESDYHPVMMNRDVLTGIRGLIRFPENFERD